MFIKPIQIVGAVIIKLILKAICSQKWDLMAAARIQQVKGAGCSPHPDPPMVPMPLLRGVCSTCHTGRMDFGARHRALSCLSYLGFPLKGR